jgi:basic amino acid/polyamine antiporter, APA family
MSLHGAMPNEVQQPGQALTLLDTTSIIVGIIIGSAVYQIAPGVMQGAVATARGWMGTSEVGAGDGSPLAAASMAVFFGVWIVGGLIAMIGAMCYAELATAYPQVGGTYVYLSESLGRTVGFAFAWVEFWIVRPGNIGAVAFVLAAYGEQLLPPGVREIPWASAALAAGAIVFLAVLNAIGLRTGKGTQNLLTACKVIGLLAVVAVGLTASPAAGTTLMPAAVQGSLSVALIQIMFAYGGWTDMSFVAAEVRQPERNIFRALLLGTATVVAIYLLVNLAFLWALGLEGLAQSSAPAADLLTQRMGAYGSKVISLLVVVSCLGAVNGMLFTGSRVFYALGTHHPMFRWLGDWNEHTQVPLRSLVMQVVVTLGLVAACGNKEGFERLVAFTAPFYWGPIGLVGISLILLRLRGATTSAKYRVPMFPLTPIIFAASSGAMVYAGVVYSIEKRSVEGWWAAAVVVSGLVVGWIDWRTRHR